MLRPVIRTGVMIGAVGLLAACAGGPRAGTATPGLAGGGRADAPVAAAVRDPAPIVSGTMRPYHVRGRWYQPQEQPSYDQVGTASWYGAQFNGRPTASGERFDMNGLTAAHKTLPLPGLVEVTNLETGQSLVLRVNDRGPFVEGRIIDLSRGAAERLGILGQGVGQVRVRYLGRAPRLGGDQPSEYAASAPRSERAATAEPGRYWVQVGAFADRANARRAVERLGDEATIDAARADGGTLFRVLVGPWPDANRAEQARNAVVARGYADALLISGP